MYQGKRDKRSRRKLVKTIALLVSLPLVICLSVSGTIAFLMDTDGSLNNRFITSQVTTSVEETWDGTTKSNVYIKNTGDTESWIRAVVIVTWKNDGGEVYGKKPHTDLKCGHGEGCTCDYIINYGKNNWEKAADDFYYYKKPVAAGDKTEALISECTYKTNAPDGYYLNVEIIGSGIQSVPDKVAKTEWSTGVSDITIENGQRKLVIKTGGTP